MKTSIVRFHYYFAPRVKTRYSATGISDSDTYSSIKNFIADIKEERKLGKVFSASVQWNPYVEVFR